MTTYMYRNGGGSYFCLTDDIKDVRGSGDVYVAGTKLTVPDIERLLHESDVDDARREVARAEERLRASEDRLRIHKLRSEPGSESNP